jgi:hypothetical protein
MKRNKINKDNFEKKTKKIIKKTMWRNTVAIHNVLKKKTKFSTNLIVKQKSTKTILKKKR